MSKNQIKLSVFILFVVGLFGAYFFTPLGEYLEIDKLTKTLEGLPDSWPMMLAFLVVFAIGGVTMAPIPLLAFATSLVFGMGLGAAITLVGVAIASSTGYLLGYLLNVETFGSFVEKHLNNFKDSVGDKGAWAVLGLRIAPTPPFTITSILSGSISLDFPRYLMGSIIGIAPLSLSAIFFGESALKIMQDPSGLASTGLVAAVILFGVYFVAKKRITASD